MTNTHPDTTVEQQYRPVWFAALIVAFLVFAWRIGHEPLWLDEAYSMAMTQHGLVDILRLTTGDVHPPLYYLILKLVTLLLGDSPIVLRLPSLFATVGLLALGAGPVRRIYGNRTAHIYALLVATSPGVLCFAQEARMYTLTAFLVTGAVLYGYLALVEQGKANLPWLGLFTWTAAMTHYYGLVAAAANCLALIVAAGAMHRGRLRPLLLTTLLASSLYLPWFFAFARQVAAVKASFWIPQTSYNLLTFGLVAPFTYKFEDVPYPWQAPTALGIITVTVTATLVIKTWRGPNRMVMAQLHTLGVYLTTLGVALGFSKLIQPIFMPRYMTSCAGLLLLMAAVGLGRLPRPRLVATTTALIVALGLPAWLRIQVATFNGPFSMLANHIRNANDSAPILLHNDVQAFYPSWHAVPTAHHVLLTPRGSRFDASGGGVYETSRLASTDALDTLVNSTKRFWVVDAEPAAFHVDPSQFLRRDGWHSVSPAVELSLPMSWVKLRLTRYEK